MRLQHLTDSSDDGCVLCTERQSDPDREDGLCRYCGEESDFFEDHSETELLELELMQKRRDSRITPE